MFVCASRWSSSLHHNTVFWKCCDGPRRKAVCWPDRSLWCCPIWAFAMKCWLANCTWVKRVWCLAKLNCFMDSIIVVDWTLQLVQDNNEILVDVDCFRWRQCSGTIQCCSLSCRRFELWPTFICFNGNSFLVAKRPSLSTAAGPENASIGQLLRLLRSGVVISFFCFDFVWLFHTASSRTVCSKYFVCIGSCRSIGIAAQHHVCVCVGACFRSCLVR